jgi:hypothetical protein
MPALPLLLVLASVSHAQGQWTTYLHTRICNDLIAMQDTVWLATGEAGLVRYIRSTDSWLSITREPNGLAGNDIQAIAFDRSGNLFAAVPGKGVSRLDTGGRWSLINRFDGLPSDSALVLRAQGDTVWIGTTRGLALWDGKTIAGSVPDLGTPSPFTNNTINGIVVTGDTLWISNPTGVQIARISEQLATWTLVDLGLPVNGSLANQEREIRGLVADGLNVLTLASGVNPSNTSQPVFTSFRWLPLSNRWGLDFPPSPPNPVEAVSVRRLRDDFGHVLATTLAGVYARSTDGTWTPLVGSPATDNIDGPQLEVGADPTGHVFAFVGEHLLEEGSPGFLLHVPPGPVGNSCRTITWANGSVYGCFAGEGVGRLRDGVWRNFRGGITCALPGCDPDTTFTNSTFPAGTVVDPYGTKWIGMWGGELARFDDEVDPPRFRNIPFVSGDPTVVHLHSCIHAAAADSNRAPHTGVWFGLDSDIIGDTGGSPLGLDVYDTSGTFIRNYATTYPGLRNGLIRALAVDKGNKMWIGYSTSGLSTFEVPADPESSITLSDVPGTERLNVFGIAINGDSVWVLADDALHRFHRGNREQASTLRIAGAPSLASMHPMAVAKDGTLYVGTGGGLRVHRRGQLPVDFTPDNSPLADIEVRAVDVDPSGVVWIGSAGGVNRYDPSFKPPVPPPLHTLTVTLYPNPAWLTGLGFELRVKGQATSYDGEVYDLSGRVVHRFHAPANGSVLWSGRDLEQNRVGPGIYFVRVRGGGAETTSRVVVLR